MMLQRIDDTGAAADISTPVAVEQYHLRELLAARESFWEYRVAMSPRLLLRGKWFPRSLAGKLRKFWDDYRAGKRPILLIGAPPQHGKSLTVIDFIAWAAGQDPQLRVIYTSFSDRLSIRANLRLQRALDSPLYRQIFPGTRISAKGSTRAELRNFDILEFIGGEGYFRNSTVLGAITGEALDLGVIDDPLKGRAEANSLNVREKVWLWLVDDVLTRFSDRAGLLLIMTRWHLDDPAGRLIERFGERVTLVRYAALAEQDERHRKVGEPLFPELKSLEFLEQRRAIMTRSSWQALYQQSPIIAGGELFPLEKVDFVPAPPAAENVLAAARYFDKAGTAGGGAYTAGVLLLRMRDGTFVVADVRRGQWSALDRERVIRQVAVADHELYPMTKFYVEQEPGSGGKESAESTVRMLAGYSAAADRVSGSKDSRADPFAAQWQAGNVRLVAAPWNKLYLDEAEHFPSGKYKDQIDASTGAFNKVASKYRYDGSLSWVS
jgi:predicted phage terminase large subunit-like protein